MQVLTESGRFTAAGAAHYVEQLRVPSLSCGTYSIPAGGHDPQNPHTEDELYLCTAGRATLWTPGGTAVMTPGTVVFVPAGEPHRVVDVAEDFATVVVFGPAERTGGG